LLLGFFGSLLLLGILAVAIVFRSIDNIGCRLCSNNFLVPFVTGLFAMNCFTSSGLSRFACWLIYVNALSTNFIVVSALPLFFMLMRTFIIVAGLQVFWMVYASKPATPSQTQMG
jgi:hypothetical protein